MALDTAAKIEELIRLIPEQLQTIPEAEMITPRSPGKWSKLQILGHLCDSAVNNLTRIVQIQYLPEPLKITPYNQDSWVAAQRYAEAPVEEIVSLWISLNRSMVRVISAVPAEALLSSVVLPSGEKQTLKWLIDDYLEHMNHHLRQLFGEDLPG